MPTAELSPRSRVDVAHSWDLPISPTEPPTDGDSFLEEQDARPAEEHLFQPAERSDIYQILMDFGLRRKLIVGAAIVATLAVGVLAYVLWPAAGEKKGRKLQKPLQEWNPNPSFRARRLRAPLSHLYQHQLP